MTDPRGGPTTDRLRYLSAAQHEVNTPIAVIRGWADTLVTMWDELDEADRVRGAGTIRRCVGDLVELLDAVFVEARLDAHGRREPERTQLVPAVTDAVDMTGPATFEPREGDIAIEVPTSEPVIAALVSAVSEGLSRACDDATVLVSVEAPDEARAGGVRRAAVTFRVADVEGSDEDLFAPFPDGRPSPAGIRLSGARDLARVLGGDLEGEVDGDLVLRLLLPGV